MRRLFRNKKQKSEQDETVIIFHEDFYRQIELVPVENYFERNSFIENLPDNAASEYGFEYCRARKEQPIKISERKIYLEPIKELFTPLASDYFTHVEAAYGSTVTYKKENTVVWGFDRYGVFAETDKDGIVESIYLCQNNKFFIDNNGDTLSKALFLLGQQYDLVLIDWNQEIIIRFYSKPEIEKYLVKILNFDVHSH